METHVPKNVPEAVSGHIPDRCVIILDESLPPGRAANAAAVMALTVGQRHPFLVGQPLVDASGKERPGLIPIGIAVLCAPARSFRALLEQAEAHGCDVVAFPTDGQQTTDYDAFRDAVRAKAPEAIEYLGVALVGQKKRVRKLVGNFALMK